MTLRCSLALHGDSGQGTRSTTCLLSQAALSQGVKMPSGGSSDSVGLTALVMDVRTGTDCATTSTSVKCE